MSAMIERVAMAMVAAMRDGKGKIHDQTIEGGGQVIDGFIDFEPLARAAIEAMREPTLTMRKATRFEFAEVDWPAMIDAALTEKPA